MPSSAFVEIEFRLAHFRVAARPKFHQVVVLHVLVSERAILLPLIRLAVISEWTTLACRLTPPTDDRSKIHHGLGVDARIKPRLWRQLIRKLPQSFLGSGFR